MTAGKEFTVQTYMQANHVGDCFLYLSVPGENIDSPVKWYKIYENLGCGAEQPYTNPPTQQSLTFTIPKGVSASNHSVLRFEWQALQLTEQVEFYVNCADVKVENDNKQTTVKSESIVSINGLGYLNAPDRIDYRIPSANRSDHHLVGPALAEYTILDIPTSSDIPTFSDVPTSPDTNHTITPSTNHTKECQKPDPVVVTEIVNVTTTVFTYATSYVT
eukprot:Pgem_evm1s19486